MWRVWYLKHRVREILENKDGVGVVEIILIYRCTDFTCRYIQISAHKSGRDDFREDYKREQRYLKGEVTVYLSLVFILLISFAGAMLESASLQNVKNYRRADMTRAVESIFAEYQKELWEVYGIFALEGSYDTEQAGWIRKLQEFSY